MKYHHTSVNQLDESLVELAEAFLALKNEEEVILFLKDLCTPQEIKAFVERWRVCRLLDQEELSYRDINELTGASLVTIGRVARFLKTEPHQGYRLVLDRMYNNISTKKIKKL